MKPGTYFLASLALPIAVLLAAWPLWWDGRPEGMFEAFMASSLMYAGIPYVFFALVMALLLRKAPLNTIQVASSWSPIPFALIVVAYIVLFAARDNVPDRGTLLGVAGITMAVSTTYWWVVHIGYRLLTVAGVIDAERGRPRAPGAAAGD